MLFLDHWHKFLKLSTEKVQHLVGEYKVYCARNHSVHKIRCIYIMFFFFYICNKLAAPKVAPGNLQTNIYT